jgi:hypothetical protein
MIPGRGISFGEVERPEDRVPSLFSLVRCQLCLPQAPGLTILHRAVSEQWNNYRTAAEYDDARDDHVRRKVQQPRNRLERIFGAQQDEKED